MDHDCLKMFCYFFVAQMAHPSSHSPSLLWTHFMPLFLHLLFVCCRTVPASEFHPSSKPTNHGTPTEVPCDPHYLPVSSVCLCLYDFVCVCVCTGCFHIWRLSCVFLQAHSHALLILPPPPSLFLQTPLLLKLPFPARARQKVGFQRIGTRELASESCCVSVFFCEARFWYVG